MRNLMLLLVALLALAGCKDKDPTTPEPETGTPKLAVVSGNYQTAAAGTDSLSDPVVGKLVRQKDGKVAWSLLPALYAQTADTVTGSPVPGAVVCSAALTEGGPAPFTVCTNTDSAGRAVFFFSGGTKADQHMSEIRGTVGDEPAVFDTVFSTVTAGAPMWSVWWDGNYWASPDTLRLYSEMNDIRDIYGNTHAWRIEADCCVHPISTSHADWWQSRTLVADSVGAGIVRILLEDSTVHATGTVTVDSISSARLKIIMEFPHQRPES